jgi:hypothetical protein
LHVGGVGLAAEDGVAEDDFAAHVGMSDPHVAEADGGVAAAGFKDLNEFAIFKGRIRCLADAEPIEDAAGGQEGQDGQRADAQPETAAVIASFVHGTTLRGARRPFHSKAVGGGGQRPRRRGRDPRARRPGPLSAPPTWCTIP